VGEKRTEAATSPAGQALLCCAGPRHGSCGDGSSHGSSHGSGGGSSHNSGVSSSHGGRGSGGGGSSRGGSGGSRFGVGLACGVRAFAAGFTGGVHHVPTGTATLGAALMAAGVT
jgi:hypothetical protein